MQVFSHIYDADTQYVDRPREKDVSLEAIQNALYRTISLNLLLWRASYRCSESSRVLKTKILRMPKPAKHESSDSARHLPPVTILHRLDAAEETASAEKIEKWLRLADTVLQQQGYSKRA